jgi:hypothetical protein
MYKDEKVFVQKLKFLDMDEIAGYSGDVQLCLMPLGGSTPENSFVGTMKWHSKIYGFSIRGKKKKPLTPQVLEDLLTGYLLKFIDYSDDTIISIGATEDIDLIEIDQKGRTEMAYILMVNTVDLLANK